MPDTITLHHGSLSFQALTEGEGPVVLCLHGFPDCYRSFRHQLPALADAGFRAVSVSLRGYEPESQPADGDYSQDSLASDVLACLNDLGVERAHLVGHDWGAAIACRAAATAPTRFHSLTMIAVPHAGRFVNEAFTYPRQLRLSWYMFFFQLRGLADYVVARRDYRFIRWLWQDWSPGWTPEEEEFAAVIETLRRPGVTRAALAYYRDVLSPGNWPIGAGRRGANRFPVAVPTLAITGATDHCIDSGVFQNLMHSEDFPAGLCVEELSDAGHFAHQERPEVVNRLLLEWFRESGAAGG